MVIRAAVPLLVELGPTVTTLQIARAAGISEPTVFRAFVDKNELLAACLEHVTEPTHLIDGLAAIDPTASLLDRVKDLVETVRAQGERVGSVVAAVALAGSAERRGHRDIPAEERRRLDHSRTTSFQRTHEAVVDVLAPDAEMLRIPVDAAANLILQIVMALGRGGGWSVGPASLTTDALADLLVHGIAT
jgi:AcrR family transcriptional regulator